MNAAALDAAYEAENRAWAVYESEKSVLALHTMEWLDSGETDVLSLRCMREARRRVEARKVALDAARYETSRLRDLHLERVA